MPGPTDYPQTTYWTIQTMPTRLLSESQDYRWHSGPANIPSFSCCLCRNMRKRDCTPPPTYPLCPRNCSPDHAGLRSPLRACRSRTVAFRFVGSARKALFQDCLCRPDVSRDVFPRFPSCHPQESSHPLPLFRPKRGQPCSTRPVQRPS